MTFAKLFFFVKKKTLNSGNYCVWGEVRFTDNTLSLCINWSWYGCCATTVTYMEEEEMRCADNTLIVAIKKNSSSIEFIQISYQTACLLLWLLLSNNHNIVFHLQTYALKWNEFWQLDCCCGFYLGGNNEIVKRLYVSDVIYRHTSLLGLRWCCRLEGDNIVNVSDAPLRWGRQNQWDVWMPYK